MAVEVNWTALALEDIENIAKFIAKDSEHYVFFRSNAFFTEQKYWRIIRGFGKPVPEVRSKSIRQLIEGNYRIIYRIVSAKRIDVFDDPSSKQVVV